MNNIKTTASFMSAFCFAALLFAGDISAQILLVSSVSVDTCWNSDSSWYDNNGVQQQRTSRDCRICFTPQGEGMARMFIAMSVDSGKTWEQFPNPLSVMNNALASTFITGQKATITVRVLGGDRPGTVFKMTARQAAPVIAGNPKSVILGLTKVLTPGQNVSVPLGLRLADATSADGFCALSKVYWDALGDGMIDDSTTGIDVLSWTWLTQVPAGVLGQKRGLIVRAVDKNGLWSAPETLSVRFWVAVDSVTDIDGNVYHVVQIGNQQWTMENLQMTRYSDGTAIPKDTSTVTWSNATTPKYCYYKNTTNPDSIKKFGALYNWYVVDPANPKKISPSGWHVPTDSEWTVLENYLIANGYNWDGTTVSNKIAKAMAAKNDWITNSVEGSIGCDLPLNNSSGFSGLPGGARGNDGSFSSIGEYGVWWSATEIGASDVLDRELCYLDSELGKVIVGSKSLGFSVRLVRDN